MVEKQPPPLTDQKIDQKQSSFKIRAAAAILAAAIAVSPFTKSKEGTIYKAYLDPAKIATICTGHTQGVRIGQTATKEQCEKMLIEDQQEHGLAVVNANPELVTDTKGLQASLDFTFNAGGGAWNGSPMSVNFKASNRAKACSSFIGYYTGATYNEPQKNLKCVPHPAKPGKWKCELPGLVLRRKQESSICLTGKF